MMEMFIGLQIFIILILAGFVVVWIWALIDIITSRFKEDLMQIVWLLIVFFLPFLGLLLYLLIGRGMKRPTQSAEESRYDHLLKLKELLDQGIITPEEFEAEKQKILGRG